MRWLPHRGGAQDFRDHTMVNRGKPFPVAVVIGADPATLLRAVMPIPDELSEYQFAGLLRGGRTELVKTIGSDLLVPSNAEIVLEGYILPDENHGSGYELCLIHISTGYFEPLLKGSRVRKGKFRTALYRQPDDLLVVDLASAYPQLKGLRLRGKLDGNRVVPYETRAEIEKSGKLAGHEIVWVYDVLDACFLEMQGSGRVYIPESGCLLYISHMRIVSSRRQVSSHGCLRRLAGTVWVTARRRA